MAENPAEVEAAAAAEESEVEQEELDEEGTEEDGDEPYELAALRRIHEHFNILLEEYDEFTAKSLHDGFKEHVTSILESIGEHLDSTEELFEELAGEVEDVEPLDYSSKSEETEDAVPAGDDERELPTPAEAAEATMKQKNADALLRQTAALRGKYLKALRKHYKALPSESADVTPEKARQILKDGTVHGKPLTDKQRGMFGAIAGGKNLNGKTKGEEQEMEEIDNVENVEHPGLKNLTDYHKKDIRGAGEHLEQLSQAQELTDEDRMKSYHWHKSLEDVKQELTPVSEDPQQVKSAETESDKQDRAAEVKKKHMEDAAAQQVNVEHPHMKAIDAASGFLHRMSTEKAFGDAHRSEAVMHRKALDPIGREDAEVSVERGDAGQMGEKAMMADVLNIFAGMKKDLASVRI